jgi:hypothetical protein
MFVKLPVARTGVCTPSAMSELAVAGSDEICRTKEKNYQHCLLLQRQHLLKERAV